MSDSPATATAAREKSRPPRDNLVRAMRGGIAVRPRVPNATRAEGDAEPSANANGMPTMHGHYATFNEWYEVNSYFEGHFLERIAPGASKKTTREQTPIVLFNHGMDGSCGDKPLGAPENLREDDTGPAYEVPLLDASYVRDLVPGLEAGLYGASFRFSVMREEWVDEPGVSDDNPAGLPERTIKEMRVSEFGPVSFPANPGATAGVRSTAMRSMTDEYLMARYTSEPDGLRSILAYLEERDARPVLEAAEPLTEALQDLKESMDAQIALAERVGMLTTAEVIREMSATLASELDTAPAADESRSDTPPDTPEQEPPADATAPAKDTTDTKTAAPERSSTPLYTGKHDALAAPGEPTPLYIGHKTRKEWEL